MNKKREKKKREYEIRRLKRFIKRKRKKRGEKIVFHKKIEYYHRVYDILKDKNFETTPKRGTFQIPLSFTISDDTEEVIRVTKKMFSFVCDEKNAEIVFDHSECKDTDLAANVVMDTVLLAATNHRMMMHKPINISGKYPRERDNVRKMLETSGIIKHLKAKTEQPISLNGDVETFDMQQGVAGSKKSGIIATKLMKYFNRCLKHQECKLTSAGESLFGKIFGEVINNSEIHGGEKSVWYTTGFCESDRSKNRANCQIVFLNYGDSIYERLSDKNQTSKETINLLDHMDKAHKSKYKKGVWNKETLFTVLSLQERISRLRDTNSQGNKNRGTGTIRMLETFKKLGGTVKEGEPKMDIISGHVHIRIDNQYTLKSSTFNDMIWGASSRQIIAFNKDNDLFKPADSSKVQYLKEYFPGTVISMNFYLDKKYIEEIKGGK